MSYPISGLNYSKGRYQHPGYVVDHPIVPVGESLTVAASKLTCHTSHSTESRLRSLDRPSSPSPRLQRLIATELPLFVLSLSLGQNRPLTVIRFG